MPGALLQNKLVIYQFFGVLVAHVTVCACAMGYVSVIIMLYG